MGDVGVYPESMPEDWRKSPSDDFVSRKWLLCEYDKRHKGPPGGARKMIEEAPPADVRPVVRGEWIETGSFDQYYQPIYECSHCHREVADYFMTKHLFCLHCGADMNMRGIL